MFERVSKRESEIAWKRADSLILAVQEEVRDRYRFQSNLVGSGKWGTMVKDKDGHYDLDYQLRLTHKSPVFERDEKFKDPTKINADFLKAFNNNKAKGERFQDSTTAITLINTYGQPFHIDFVIIDDTGEKARIIRRNIKNETPSKDEKTWNELPNMHWAFGYFSGLHPDDKKYIIEEMVIPAKQKEKAKSENDKTKRSSSEVFIAAVVKFDKEFSR